MMCMLRSWSLQTGTLDMALTQDCSAWAYVLGCRERQWAQKETAIDLVMQPVVDELLTTRRSSRMPNCATALRHALKTGLLTRERLMPLVEDTVDWIEKEGASVDARLSLVPEPVVSSCAGTDVLLMTARTWAEWLEDLADICAAYTRQPESQRHEWWGRHGWWTAEAANRGLLSRADRRLARAAETIQATWRGRVARLFVAAMRQRRAHQQSASSH